MMKKSRRRGPQSRSRRNKNAFFDDDDDDDDDDDIDDNGELSLSSPALFSCSSLFGFHFFVCGQFHRRVSVLSLL